MSELTATGSPVSSSVSKIERNRHQRSCSHVDEVTGRNVARVGAAFDESLPLAGGERLHRDVRLAPL